MKAPKIVSGNPTRISFRAVLCLPGFLIDGRSALIMSVLHADSDGKSPPIITVNKPAAAPKIRCCMVVGGKENLKVMPGEKGWKIFEVK